jgi:hypothetical protein
MLGQAHAYQITLQEISNLLKPKEQKDEQGNIIDFGNQFKMKTPKHVNALEEKYEKEKSQVGEVREPLHPDNLQPGTVDELPTPSGYRLLVLPFTPKEKTRGGILFSQETLDRARIATTCGYVLKMGDLAYKGQR